MPEIDDVSRCVFKGLTLISYRPRSTQEMKRRLTEYVTRRGLSQHAIDPAIERLREMGYINDNSFAAWFISSYQGKKAKGYGWLKKKLEQEHISKDIIQSVLLVDSDEEFKKAKAAVAKKIERWSTLPLEMLKRRVYDYLLRRGFSSDVIHRLVDEKRKSAYNTDTEFDI